MSDIETRPIFTYTCISCDLERRTLLYSRAMKGQCMKCKRNHVPDKNQPALFERKDES